jgi:phosphoglycerol transferase
LLISITFIGWLIFRVGQHPINLPLTYSRDALFSLMQIKNLVTNNQIFYNQQLGFPFGQNLLDFPAFDWWHFCWLKFFSWFTKDIFLIQNIFYWSTFYSIAFTSYYSLRRLQLSFWLACMGSLLFTFLPFHLLRNTNHLFLSDYSLIPLVILLTLELSTNQIVTLLPVNYSSVKNKFWLALLALLISSSGIYYAFFSIFFIMLGLLFNILKYKNKLAIKKTIYIILIILLGLITQFAPTFKYHQLVKTNLAAVQRLPLEAEIYSLKFNQLIFPLNLKWLSVFHLAKPTTFVSGKLKGEGTEYLGIVGVVGLGLILSWPIIKHFFNRPTKLAVNRLSYLTVTGILLSISTGLGTVLAYVFSSQIRAYTRISPYLALMCIMTFLLISQQILNNLHKKSQQQQIAFLVTIICFISLIDQISWYKPDTLKIQTDFTNDQNFVQLIESSLPANSAIIQLPYKAFPESPPINKLEDYELVKPYLHSQNLKWSYGMVKGRPADLWYQQTASQSAQKLVAAIEAQGFAGILINKNGYEDDGELIEASLSAILKSNPLVSADNINEFFLLK